MAEEGAVTETCNMRVVYDDGADGDDAGDGGEGYADCPEPATCAGYCRVHAEQLLDAERAFVKLHELSAGRARGKVAELEQALGIAVVPALLFHPREVILPLDTAPAFFEGEEQMLAFIADRVAKGDPGPLHIQNGLAWTDASDVEDEAEAETLTEIATIRVETLFENGGWRVDLEAPREKAAAHHFGAVSRQEGVAVALVLLSRVVIGDRVESEPARVLDEALERAVEMYDEQLPVEFVGKGNTDNANSRIHRT